MSARADSARLETYAAAWSLGVPFPRARLWATPLAVAALPAAGLALAFLLFAAPGRGAAQGVPFRIVLTNDAYSTLAVDHRGVAYGLSLTEPSSSHRLYSSTSEGLTWAPVADFPSCSRVMDISVLGDDTLLAHVNNCDDVRIYRSDDHGATWTSVFTFPQPVAYRTLTPHSITDDGSSVYLGSYNTLDETAHENFVWRSDDDGRTWQVVLDVSTHRHIHFVQADPSTHWVYVGYGDAGLAEIDVSRDRGTTWSPLCTGDQCLAVDMAFDPFRLRALRPRRSLWHEQYPARRSGNRRRQHDHAPARDLILGAATVRRRVADRDHARRRWDSLRSRRPRRASVREHRRRQDVLRRLRHAVHRAGTATP